MEYVSRDELRQQFTDTLGELMDRYHLDDAGVFEEEGPEERFYMGYTIRKSGHVYMIHLPYVKNEAEQLAVEKEEWTIEKDDGEEIDGIATLDEVFNKIH
ncbi:DUF5634 family protein [Radiobacillus sp. PE A8.2]|uniref:DUF5634 family protein n=1 Tax=Radiobacillus sp. PE A8.2 TaxID=3380349 RepID=UPI003890F622